VAASACSGPGATIGDDSAGWGGFDDANAVGVSAAGLLAGNLIRIGLGTLVLDGGLGIGTDQFEGAIGW